jgi:hypothetical protein
MWAPFLIIAGLVPTTPIMWHGRALLSGVAGTSPAVTINANGRAPTHHSEGPQTIRPR